MLNLYKNISRQQEKANKEQVVTGHDRYCQERPTARSSHRRRRPVTRRALSASEFNPRELADANARTRCARSASTDEEDEAGSHVTRSRPPAAVGAAPGERTPLLSNKLETLGRLFKCVAVTSRESPDRLGHVRHGGRYQYTALEPDSNVHEKLELEKKNRERAQNACLHYLRACPRYTLIHQLNDIGSRVDKHWFVVRDTSVKTERLLTLVPRGPNCPIQCNPSTRDTILNLFLALQHPYIYPVLDLDFRDVATQTYVILVLPFNNKGSLKDLIYKSKWQDDWSQKYSQRSAGLPLSQVQRLGRQVLEALLFLKDRGFPPCSHLHSGNIILQNGVARLTGLENTLLGFTSRIHPVIWSRAREEPLSVDAICFGHVLFEMCAGYELCAPEPSPSHLQDLGAYPQVVEVLDYIFQNPNHRCPSIEELLVCDFFRNIDLREMRAAPLPLAFQARLTASTISLLNEIKKHQGGKRPKKSQSASTAETTSPTLRDRSGGGTAGATDEAWAADEIHDEATVTDGQSSPAQEHRDLSLHMQDDCVYTTDTRCLLR